MTVRRITANIATDTLGELADFCRDIVGLEQVMDFGWIVTFQGPDTAPVQLSLAQQGGSGTGVPSLSIEVDDLDAVLPRARARGHEIVYGPVTEPWGMRRFYLRDPAGTLLNILSHGA